LLSEEKSKKCLLGFGFLSLKFSLSGGIFFSLDSLLLSSQGIVQDLLSLSESSTFFLEGCVKSFSLFLDSSHLSSQLFVVWFVINHFVKFWNEYIELSNSLLDWAESDSKSIVFSLEAGKCLGLSLGLGSLLSISSSSSQITPCVSNLSGDFSQGSIESYKIISSILHGISIIIQQQ